MKLPETLQRINAELHRRHAAGLSTDIADIQAKPMLDKDVGTFMRYTFLMCDGDVFAIDSTEMHPVMRKALQTTAMQ